MLLGGILQISVSPFAGRKVRRQYFIVDVFENNQWIYWIMVQIKLVLLTSNLRKACIIQEQFKAKLNVWRTTRRVSERFVSSKNIFKQTIYIYIFLFIDCLSSFSKIVNNGSDCNR